MDTERRSVMKELEERRFDISIKSVYYYEKGSGSSDTANGVGCAINLTITFDLQKGDKFSAYLSV